MPVVSRWETHKTIIREAARIARDEECIESPDTKFAKGTVLFAAARAIWTNDLHIANILIYRSSLIAALIEIQHGFVVLTDPVRFTSEIEDVKRAQIAERESQLDAAPAAPSARARTAQHKTRTRSSPTVVLSIAWHVFGLRSTSA